ncbi:MAG: hypothetical protein K1X86_02400 [Ignavibacteria bacterium]|nr:hypothetical protein [Ignavibacteria bacterium]
MKKLLFILAALVLSSGLAKADEKEKFLLKKIKSLGEINSTQCDLCGCYFGIEPNFSLNSIGIRYSYFKFVNEPHTSSVNANLDHEADPNVTETEIYSKVELVAKYNVNQKFRLQLTLPYKMNDINGKNIRDVGDVLLMGQYMVYSSDISLKNESRYRQRVYLGAGIKAPTGAFNKQLTYGVTEPHFQPGTGAFDFLFTGTYFAKYKDFGLNADASYSVATTNKNEYRFANRFNTSASFFYQWSIDQTGLMPHAGVYYETAGMDKQNDSSVDDSGGNVLFLTGGTDVYFSSFAVNLTYQYPMKNNLNGDQAGNKFRVIAGLNYYFGM